MKRKGLENRRLAQRVRKKASPDMEAIDRRMKQIAAHPKTSKEAYEHYPVDELDPEEKWRKEFRRRIRLELDTLQTGKGKP